MPINLSQELLLVDITAVFEFRLLLVFGHDGLERGARRITWDYIGPREFKTDEIDTGNSPGGVGWSSTVWRSADDSEIELISIHRKKLFCRFFCFYPASLSYVFDLHSWFVIYSGESVEFGRWEPWGKKVDGHLVDAKSDGETDKQRRVIQAGQWAYKSPSGGTTPTPGKVHSKDAEAGGGSRIRHLRTPQNHRAPAARRG